MSTTEWLEVTPGLAKRWLDESGDRPMLPSPRRGGRLAEDMARGKWIEGVSPIIRCTDGYIADG
jgi:hypothetical protein